MLSVVLYRVLGKHKVTLMATPDKNYHAPRSDRMQVKQNLPQCKPLTLKTRFYHRDTRNVGNQ